MSRTTIPWRVGMTVSILRRGGAAVGCAIALACFGGCAGDDADGDQSSPPQSEQRESAEELRVLRQAWELQNAFAAGDYETVCARLTRRSQQLAGGVAACPDKLSAVAGQALERPTIAWVRLRDNWGSVVVRKADDQLTLTRVDDENGRWRYWDLKLAGLAWPGSTSPEVDVSNHGSPPRPERRQSPMERRVLREAWELQNAFADGDYETVCAALSRAGRQAAGGARDCPDELRAEAGKSKGRPKIAWVRLRGSWGSVVVHETRGQLALTGVVDESGRWRYPDLKVVGLLWPARTL